MKLKAFKLKNFRGYKDETVIQFDDLTAFVGKNDVGKSTILEALDIFFNDNKGAVKIDQGDTNKECLANGDNTIVLTAVFTDVSSNIIIDTTYQTTLKEEYLLNRDGDLEIIKKYVDAGKAKVYLKAFHPTNSKCNDLLALNNSKLKTILQEHNIECDNKSINAVIRKAIWNHFNEELDCDDIEIDVAKSDAKSIWEQLSKYLPVYSLFQADRKNCDSDDEVQDPLKEAVKQIMKDEAIAEKLDEVAAEVKAKLQDVSDRTLSKLQEMAPEVATSLSPSIPASAELKWQDVFKNVSITGDEDIPINKRGSGVKRLILLNFFRAEAERRLETSTANSIIYAIEEPETSQHTVNQNLLVNAFKALAKADNTQVIITTHSGFVVKALDFSNLRMITNNESKREIVAVAPSILAYQSLNEVNYVAFGEVTEEYHNELYGYIEAEGHINEYKGTLSKNIPYNRLNKDGTISNQKHTLSGYIRDQIHHPENNHNPRYTADQLKESIDLMRNYIIKNINK